MRNVLHDWADEKCLEILKNTVAALSPDSAILVDEMVLPNTGAHKQAAHLDIALMSTLAAMERSERQWHTLFDAAGLQIKEIYTYESATRDSVMVVVPKDRWWLESWGSRIAWGQTFAIWLVVYRNASSVGSGWMMRSICEAWIAQLLIFMTVFNWNFIVKSKHFQTWARPLS